MRVVKDDGNWAAAQSHSPTKVQGPPEMLHSGPFALLVYTATLRDLSSFQYDTAPISLYKAQTDLSTSGSYIIGNYTKALNAFFVVSLHVPHC